MLHVTRQTISNYETGRSGRTWKCWRNLPSAGRRYKRASVRPDRNGTFRPAPAASGHGSGSDRPCCHFLFCRRPLGAAAAAGAIPDMSGYTWWFFFVNPCFYSAGLDSVVGMSGAAAVRALHSRWAVRSRRLLLAGSAVWLAAMSPWFFYLGPGLWESLQVSLGTRSSLSAVQFPFRCVFALCGPPPPRSSLWAVPCAAQLGILGFPACRSHTPPSSDAPSHILV